MSDLAMRVPAVVCITIREMQKAGKLPELITEAQAAMLAAGVVAAMKNIERLLRQAEGGEKHEEA